MGRPHKFRQLSEIKPKFNRYNPKGPDSADVDMIFLSLEEFEAMRLRHYENLKQTEASERMRISQTTYSRILAHCYKKITKALVEGYGIAIQTQIMPSAGGRDGRRGQGRDGGRGQGRGGGRGQGRGGGRGQGRGGGMDGNIFGPGQRQAEPKPVVVFRGYGCLNCGYSFQPDPKRGEDQKQNSKVVCPECQSSKTYRLIKKLTPEG